MNMRKKHCEETQEYRYVGLPNTNFDGAHTQMLFNDNFCPCSIRQHSGNEVKTSNI